ncbi:MAG: MBL fold metallo-hydrolase [Saprospiraceae bacterium]|nr:MBL fold metallo-hydrolase [Saprospiraceae bacterium]
MNVKSFVFNDFQENTYVVYDDKSLECLIIDPGCNGTAETRMLTAFIDEHHLKPVRLINTHCHIDHVLGNAYVSQTYGLYPEAHRGEIPVLASCERVAEMYGIPYMPSPHIASYLDEGDVLTLGEETLHILFCPGHSPASICLYSAKDAFVIAGDVLFHRSIGRTDLPGGDYDTLIDSIKTKLFPMPDHTVVYSGHGIPTQIGDEKKHNPFLND